MMPSEFILLDTEFTAWEGSHTHDWSRPGEFREIIEIGAIRVEGLSEVDSFHQYVTPVLNPELSEYITALTGITQETLTEKGIELDIAMQRFAQWAQQTPLYSWGEDGAVLTSNCTKRDFECPIPLAQFIDIRPLFTAAGVVVEDYMSSTIPEAFNLTPPGGAHEAVADTRSILVALKALTNR